jgi:hypothetical protein
MPSFINGYSTEPTISFAELINNERFISILDHRQSDPFFSTRIVTYSLVNFFNQILHIPLQASYNLIIIFSIGGIFLIIKRLCTIEEVALGHNISFLFLFYPVIFCMATMMAGFDDMLHWALSLCVVLLLKTGKHILAFIFFAFALLTRESIFFSIPILVFGFVENKKLLYIGIFVLLSLLCFVVLSYLVKTENRIDNFYILNREYDWKYNIIFNLDRTIWTFYSCVLFPILIFKAKEIRFKFLILHCTILLNVFLIFSVMYDEARHAFYTILFTVPYWSKGIHEWLEYQIYFMKNKLLAQIIISLFAFIFSFYWYSACPSKSCIFYSIYAFFFISFTLPFVINRIPTLYQEIVDSFKLRSLKEIYF